MSAVVALLIIWSIVALALWCCYRLWYWAPTATVQAAYVLEEDAAEAHSRAA